MRDCQRRVSFLIAEKSMHRRYIGRMARAVHASKLEIEKKHFCNEFNLNIIYF